MNLPRILKGSRFCYVANRHTAQLAQEVFADPLSITENDSAHSADEHRLLIIGISRQRRLLVVSHALRGGKIRLIGARRATQRERFKYEEDRR